MKIQSSELFDITLDREEFTSILNAMVNHLISQYDWTGFRDKKVETLLLEMTEIYFPKTVIEKVISYKKMLWDNGEDTLDFDKKLTFTRSING
jgi:hypothetical protein